MQDASGYDSLVGGCDGEVEDHMGIYGKVVDGE